jgi:outer membrane protein
MSSTKLKSQADQQNVEAAKAQILLEVDGAYLSVLQAQSVMRVAEETTKARGVVRDQINALAEHQMKSSLDVGFARANYKEAELLLSRSRNDLQAAYATLAALIEEPDVAAFALTSQPSPGGLPEDVSGLIRGALQNRPDLLRLRLEHDSAAKFAKAERALRNPTLSMQGAAGVAPWHDSTLNEDYAAAGVALTWQLYTGGLYTARQREAEARAGQTDEVVRDLEINIARDVRIAWLNANNSLEQMSLTVELRQQADENMKLAQARYDTGSSSIVELSDAQLGLTSAQINETDAKYLYLVRRAALDYQIGLIERRH